MKGKLYFIVNKLHDDTDGREGLKVGFNSIAEAERFLRSNSVTPGHLRFTLLSHWKAWKDLDLQEIEGYGIGTRVSFYTSSHWRVEEKLEGENITYSDLPEIMAIRSAHPDKPLDMSDFLNKPRTKRMTPGQKQVEVEKLVQAEKDKEFILYIYAKNYAHYPKGLKISDLSESGQSSKDILNHFPEGIDEIDRAARESFSEYFEDFRLNGILNRKYFKKVQDELGDKDVRRFVVTTAVADCPVDEAFLDSLRTYCIHNEAKLLILYNEDPAHNWVKNLGPTTSKSLEGETWILEDTELNSNVSISTIQISAKNINPLTGLLRLGQVNGSMIVAHPKQQMITVPMGNDSFPHIQTTTGAITLPDYNTTYAHSRRTAFLATHDHVIGAVVVEVEDDKIFHLRHIRADEDGSFRDLGVLYTEDSAGVEAPEYVVWGDYHSGETDPVAEEATILLSEQTGAKKAILHDVFNGISVNHHERKKRITRGQHFDNSNLVLSEELSQLAGDLNYVSENYEEVIIVKSNHDEFLDRYLEAGEYLDDPQNHYMSLKLAVALFEKRSPLEEGVKLMGLTAENIRWLSRDEDFTPIEGIQLGAHGDKGLNGRRGTPAQMEIAYGNSVTGHTHSPSITRGAFVVGTTSKRKMSYNVGPSSWMQTCCLVYKNGQRQLVNFINGRYTLLKEGEE